ncbi:hypothetical protein REPUB_Repub03eG0046200 [Reevesia pubescens]
MGRSPCCSKEGMNRGAWTATKDKILTDYIKVHGEGKWRNIPMEAGLKRCGKSCRLRWMNYLRPDIRRGNITSDEEDLIIRLHNLLGNRWSLIAGRLPGRTDNEIKNYWNTHLSKREQGKERRRKSNHAKVEKKPISGGVDEEPINPCVIRTKASRCKEVFITPDDKIQQHRIENHDRNVAIPPSNMDAKIVHNIAAESESSDGSLTALMSCNEENYSLDFMVDINAGEASVSEILASGFPKHDLGTSEMDNVIQGDSDNYTSKIAESQAFLLPEEMEQSWSGSDYNIQANLDSGFVSLLAFLESAEDWII